MPKPRWSSLLLGVLLTAVIACQPISEDDQEPMTAESVPEATLTPVVASQLATLPIPSKSAATSSPPPAPTSAPTTSAFAGWLQIGNPATGLELLAPPDWINLSGQVDTAVSVNELGITVLLLADSERTGNGLLGNKAIGEGAYAAGLIAHLDLPPNTPQNSLNRLAEDLTLENRSLVSQAMPVSATVGSGGLITGAYIDLVGAPLLFPSSGNEIRSRIYLFSTSLTGAISQQSQAMFIMSTPASQWERYEGTFEKISRSIVLHNIYADLLIQDGSANVLGNLGEQDLVNGNLDANVKDVWTFNLQGPRYATLTLSPDNKDIDLILSLISPTGQTVTRIDNGYAGDTESVIDNLLLDSGLYVVEVSEFFGDSGRYTLSLVLTEDPLFGGGGRIGFGQTIQSNLGRGGQHVWKFDGDGGDLVSIVLTPEDPFDAILEIYGPDDTRLEALDEGFSGDAEVISGLELPLTGEYSILVRSFAGEGGSYSLSLDEGSDSTTNFYDAGDLIFGQISQESLQENEAHAWFFTGRAGDELLITVTPLTSNLDLDIWLLNENVERLAEQDLLLSGEPERINFVLPENGQYIILVRDFFGEPGRYEINLQGNRTSIPDNAGTISFGETKSGVLQPDQSVIWYFEASDGDVVDISLAPGDDSPDLLFYVFDPDGNQVWQVDATQAGEVEEILSYPLMGEGRWSIVIEEFFGDEAAYRLQLEVK